MLVDITEQWRAGHLEEVIQWLIDNVGPYYGPGEGNVAKIGSGWELVMGGDLDCDGFVEVESMKYYVDLNNSKNATWFAMQWGT